MTIPESLKYTREHEWLSVSGNTGTIGVTEYAQGELGDVVYINFNEGLTEVKKGEIFGSIEAVKTVSDLYAPCSGKVLAINTDLNNNPEIVNKDPYGEGWMLKVELSNPSEIDELLDSTAYAEFIGK